MVNGRQVNITQNFLCERLTPQLCVTTGEVGWLLSVWGCLPPYSPQLQLCLPSPRMSLREGGSLLEAGAAGLWAHLSAVALFSAVL